MIRGRDGTDDLEAESVVATLRDGRLWRLSVSSGLYLYAQVAIIGFGVLFLHDEHGLSDSTAALVVAASQVLAVGLRIGAGRWSDLVGSRVGPLRRVGLAVAVSVGVTACSPAGRCGRSSRRWPSPAGSRWPGTVSRSRPPPSSRAPRAAVRRSGSSRRSCRGSGCSRRSCSRGASPRGRGRRRSGSPRCSRCRCGLGRCGRCVSHYAPRVRISRSPRAHRERRRAVRDRRRPGREPAARLGRGGRGARASRRVARGGRAGGRGRPTRQPLRTCPGVRHGVRHRTSGTGSHLDTVPRGGRFDGSLGVVAAIEAVERVGAGSVVVFRGEEVGCIGSRALVASGDPLPRAFLELHVEQGPVLAAADASLGVVTGIVGYARGELVLDGRAGTLGRRRWRVATMRSSPPRPRSCASAMPRSVSRGRSRRSVRSRSSRAARTSSPSRVRLSLDVARAGCREAGRAGRGDRVRAGLPGRAGALRGRAGARSWTRSLPVGSRRSSSRRARGTTPGSSRRPGSTPRCCSCGACGGVSHSPDELSSEEDVSLAVDVLADALERVATSR